MSLVNLPVKCTSEVIIMLFNACYTRTSWLNAQPTAGVEKVTRDESYGPILKWRSACADGIDHVLRTNPIAISSSL